MSSPTHAIVVAASAGGLEPLEQLVRPLPAEFEASVFIVHHTGPTAPGYLAAILNRRSRIPCAYATDDEPMRAGRVYIAPPDRHLEIAGHRLRTTSGPKENNVRPAADVLFRSAADTFGPRTIGIVVSGMLDDGAEGLAAIKAAGGRSIVQNPEEAQHRSMPDSALARLDVDACVPASKLAATVLAMIATAHTAAPADTSNPILPGNETPSDTFTCPDCGGPIAIMDAPGGLKRFACLVGHKYSESSFLHALEDVRERTLWSANRLLRQHASLHGIRADRARRQGNGTLASHFDMLATRAREDADVIEAMVGAADQLETLGEPERAMAAERRHGADGDD